MTPSGTLGIEGRAAAAGALRVRVLDREARAHEPFAVVEDGAAQVKDALGVDHDADAARREDLVVGLGLVEVHEVGHPAAAAALDADPEGPDRRVLLLAFHEALQLGRRQVGNADLAREAGRSLDRGRRRLVTVGVLVSVTAATTAAAVWHRTSSVSNLILTINA